MHGIVHKTLQEYVVDRTDEETWETIIDRAGLEPRLYLAVSSYDDDEIEAILSAVASMTTEDRRQIERDFGQTLAPELLGTFNAHLSDADLVPFLKTLEDATANVNAATDDAELPSVTTTREGDAVRITYHTHREPTYCGIAQGLLEGFVSTFETTATVTKRSCVADGAETCAFQVSQ